MLNSDVEKPATRQGERLEMSQVDDLAEAIAHLTSLGYPPLGEITSASHGREIYAYDPAKNRMILHQSKSSTDNE